MSRWASVLIPMCAALCSLKLKACSCPELDVAKALKYADKVFRAKVVEVKWVEQQEDALFGERRTIVSFSVSGVFKGQVEHNIVLHTRENRTSCDGFSFQVGHEYVVYSNTYASERWLGKADIPVPGQLFEGTSICSRTKEVINAVQDIAHLRRPRRPQ